MGWGKIRNRLQKVGHVIEPHAAAINLIKSKTNWGARVQGNIERESTQGVAAYGGYAGLAAQVVPGVGTAVGVGLLAATAAAKIKLQQDAVAKQNQQIKAAQAEADAMALQDDTEASYKSPPFVRDPANRVETLKYDRIGAKISDNFSDSVTANGSPISFPAFAPSTGMEIPRAPMTPMQASFAAGGGASGAMVDVAGGPAYQKKDHTWLIVGASVAALGLGLLMLLKR